ncbi:Crp/Fnr family transcriptional regulator [Mucilaginibacter sp. HC2]|uniref:Crp/Fnr family transcriptional regulator n=1 Tax=Mucilaginibacter inviolabilis TaxID=2714892 RepID=UPI00140B7110|nr:Crp/Fnr family transcriptional regulator [Mucilaginibacter inviolabilis]NHA03689.1 Crp/Fnr family transcriptional regulator [Mucilaginibacter inviolabilis]
MEFALLFNNFNKYAHVSEEEQALIEETLIKRFVKKRRNLLNQGDVSRYLYFVNKGVLRSYTIDKQGTEHVVQFALEGYWIADLCSFVTQTPGDINIDAIEDTEVLMLPHHELEILYEKIPGLEKFFRQLYQRAYVALQKRYNSSQSIIAEERYLELMLQQPDIAMRIPLIYIASYLGITAESLSRIRKKIASPKPG